MNSKDEPMPRHRLTRHSLITPLYPCSEIFSSPILINHGVAREEVRGETKISDSCLVNMPFTPKSPTLVFHTCCTNLNRVLKMDQFQFIGLCTAFPGTSTHMSFFPKSRKRGAHKFWTAHTNHE